MGVNINILNSWISRGYVRSFIRCLCHDIHLWLEKSIKNTPMSPLIGFTDSILRTILYHAVVSPHTSAIANDENHGRNHESKGQNPNSKGRRESQLSTSGRRRLRGGCCSCCGWGCGRGGRLIVAGPHWAHHIPQFLVLKNLEKKENYSHIPMRF